VRIRFQNYVHSKNRYIKDLSQNMVRVVPNGGGPNHANQLRKTARSRTAEETTLPQSAGRSRQRLTSFKFDAAH
jgi:hypothetical protein